MIISLSRLVAGSHIFTCIAISLPLSVSSEPARQALTERYISSNIYLPPHHPPPPPVQQASKQPPGHFVSLEEERCEWKTAGRHCCRIWEKCQTNNVSGGSRPDKWDEGCRQNCAGKELAHAEKVYTEKHFMGGRQHLRHRCISLVTRPAETPPRKCLAASAKPTVWDHSSWSVWCQFSETPALPLLPPTSSDSRLCSTLALRCFCCTAVVNR